MVAMWVGGKAVELVDLMVDEWVDQLAADWAVVTVDSLVVD